MHKAVVALVLIACCGCQRGAETPDKAPEAQGTTSALANRVWARSDSTGLPGVMRVFLSDGTLLMDSCWETYRLAPWRMESDSLVVWQEDGADIFAAILRLNNQELVLRLGLGDKSEVQRYHVASAPYVCPDMRR